MPEKSNEKMHMQQIKCIFSCDEASKNSKFNDIDKLFVL